MAKIEKLSLARLQTMEDFGFQTRVSEAAALLTAETDKDMVDTYKAAVTAFDAALKTTAGSEKTADLTAADEAADAAWSGLNAQIKATLDHPDKAVRTLGREAYSFIKKYGNVTTQNYDSEYGAIHNLLQDFESFGEENQKAVFADAWVKYLKESYDSFMKIRGERDTENAAKTTGAVKTARTACDAAYNALRDRVNALAIVSGDELYGAFIDKVNVMVSEAKATLAARKTNAAR